jgi:hypothetical protein
VIPNRSHDKMNQKAQGSTSLSRTIGGIA